MISNHPGYVATMTKSFKEISEELSISEPDIKELNAARPTSYTEAKKLGTYGSNSIWHVQT